MQSTRGAQSPQVTAKARLQKVSDTLPGFLRRARIRKASTRKAYDDSWSQFLSYCVSVNLLTAATSKFISMSQLDQSLEAFGESLFLAGSSKYLLTCALQNCNIQYPQWPTCARSNYPLTKAAKKGWGNLEPGASRDPCPYEVACWIAYYMVTQGLVFHAAAVMLSFDTYVRPGKICGLKHSNIIPPSRGVNKRYQQWALLLNPHEMMEPSKTGQFNDSLMVGMKGREWVGTLLGKLYTKHAGTTDGPIFPFSLNNLEGEFRNAVRSLKITKLKLSPHCLRHGGASHDYFVGNSTLPDVQQRGCWATFDSVRRYSKHGRVSKQLSLLSPSQQQAAKQACAELPQLLLRQF